MGTSSPCMSRILVADAENLRFMEGSCALCQALSGDAKVQLIDEHSQIRTEISLP